MALSKMPKMPKLPETEEEIKAFWQKIDENDAQEVKLELYFSKEELAGMCNYERQRVCNIKRNYDMMKEMGLPVKKPLFMQKNRKKTQEESSSEESDVEWTPELEKPKKKATGPVKTIWVTPTKKEKQKPSTSRQGDAEEEDLADCDFDGFEVEEKTSCTSEKKKCKSERRRLKKEVKKGVIPLEDIMLDYPADLEHFDVEAAKQMKACKGKKGRKKDKYRPEFLENRYPKRDIPKTNYADIEIPDDDHFLFCDDCHEEYLGDCPVHGPLKIVEDSKAELGTEDYAKNTAPPGLVVKESQIPKAGLGAWTSQFVERGVRLGPYKGEKVKTEDKAHVSGYSWQIYGQTERRSHYVDAGDATTSNWMRYVNCARNEEEQNLLAFQYKGEIFYRTIKDVAEHTELFVWYGEEYGKELGIQARKSPEHVKLLLSILQQQPKNTDYGERVPFWAIHGRKIEVPQSEWKLPVPHNKGFPCDVCGVVFVKKEIMQQHRKNAHRELYRTEGKKLQCEQCSYSTDNSGHLVYHMKVHTKERPFKCEQCGKGFTLAGNLRVHKRIHSGEKPYQCDVCQKRFTYSHYLNRHLNRHMNIHSNTRNYQCSFCDKAFPRHFNLKQHLKTHTGVLDFACVHCDYKANRASHLKQHVTRQHTHEYPHRCPVCNVGFVIPGRMKKHIAKKH